MAVDRYTLLIPTYNRPILLAGLLRHLTSTEAGFPILVLDSGSEATQAANREEVASSALDIRYRTFDPAIPLSVKLATAAADIRSDYMSICADDDLLFPHSVALAIAQLEERPDCIGCHGIYLNFDPAYQEANSARIGIEYFGPSIEASESLVRVGQLLARYEAPTYAVYRRQVYADVLRAGQAMKTPMFWELFCALAPLANGKLERIPHAYLARCSAAQTREKNWHPGLWFNQEPDSMIDEFRSYRKALAEVLCAGEPADTERTLTGMHFDYLADALGYEKKGLHASPASWWRRRMQRRRRIAARREWEQLAAQVIQESSDLIRSYLAFVGEREKQSLTPVS